MVLFLDLRYARLSVLVMEMQHLHNVPKFGRFLLTLTRA
jgi:hypothetical protein